MNMNPENRCAGTGHTYVNSVWNGYCQVCGRSGIRVKVDGTLFAHSIKKTGKRR